MDLESSACSSARLTDSTFNFFTHFLAATYRMFYSFCLHGPFTWILFVLAIMDWCLFSQSAVAAPQSPAITDTINHFIAQRWAEKGISPSQRSSDETFVRRLYLDLAGRIPTIVERDAFLNDGRAEKREALIDQILSSDDHALHMADLFDVFLMGRGSPKKVEQRSEHGWRKWLQKQFRDNRPWNEIAEAILLARPESEDEEGAIWFLYERENDYQKIAEGIAPAFFGVRIDCAQCHDSMIASEIEQAHYWGLVAFYNRGKNEMTSMGPRVVESAIGGFSEFANIYGSSSPNLLTFLDAETVVEVRPEKGQEQVDSEDLYKPGHSEGEPRVPLFSRRQKFVEEVLRDHPMLAPALVNRLWGMMMGQGIVHPFDQMDSAHPASHPQLLDALAKAFVERNYDIRYLLRSIALCDAYHGSSVRSLQGADPSYFAWYHQRPLTAEQLARSWQVALKQSFDHSHPLIQKMRTVAPDVLPETIVTPIAESLFFANTPAIDTFLDSCSQGDSDLNRWMSATSPEIVVREMFVSILGREPLDDEAERVAQYIGHREDEGSQPTVAPERIRHAAWALLTSAEFRFNH